ncbi:Gar1/NAF1 RNA-binding region protein (macronuclear) [Tetrahymena thermophila SB210]|uniref:H/ACA ribonucleoprotein complex non-core subunit NAF1 n=1 Tax=Tetrahymena thermophila (strain SB210) TaxID=312017 RepID=Q22HG7_TETTS|nr:Gar1/NAF1 RNA-binding region protein [Tetrahymena thermophila SB210]EAR84734.1 Gar1/NAF1 RNA-binding region protein [Tetrahymena thermophila SB210]|eukprot:XP_001032397.1 Gar1/NAF1 RNA-binding region protein [Tetrahymena thermophila SB210]
MDQEDIQQQFSQENQNIQFVNTNTTSNILPITVQNSEQLNIENQQDPTTLQADNQKQVTYYFRDSDQSEWSSSESEGEDNQNEDNLQENQIEQEENNMENDQANKKKKNKNKNTKKYDEDFFEEEDIVIDPKGEQMKTKNEAKPQKYEKFESDMERLVRFGVQFKGNEVLVELGQIMTIVDDKIIIATNNEMREAEKRIIVDLDNIIFNEQKNIIGNVDDVFGNIKNPFYCVIIDKYTEEMIAQKRLQVGQKVYMIEGYNKLLMKAQLEFLLRQKGCDASNRFDEEVLNDNEIEYSDDEMESKAKTKRNNKERKQDLEDVEEEVRNEEKQNPIKQKKNKKIMVMKNENGVLKRIFLKPSEFESLKNNPNNKIQQLPSGYNPNKFPKGGNPNNQQQQFSIPSGQNPHYQKPNYQQNKQYRPNNNPNYQKQNYYQNQQNYQGQQSSQNYQYQQQTPFTNYQNQQQQYGYQNQQQFNQIPQQQQQYYQNNDYQQNQQNNQDQNFQNQNNYQNFNNMQQQQQHYQQSPQNFQQNNQMN